mgnify:FL=1
MKNKNEISDIKIITAVRQLIDVMQVKVKNNLVEKSRDVKITKEELNAVIQVVDSTIINSFTDQIENIVKQIKTK